MLLFVTALTLPAGSSAHPGSTLTGYVSTVSALVPNVLGVNALVLGGDDRISNYSGKTVVILGYEGEPYLRFDKSGVYANTLSPAPDPAGVKQDGGTSAWLLAAGIAGGVLAAGTLLGAGARRARRRAP